MAQPPKNQKSLFDYGLDTTIFKFLNKSQRDVVKQTFGGAAWTVPREALEIGRLIARPDRETIEKQEEYLEDYLGYMFGSENIEMQQRGEEAAGGYSVANIKQPQNDLAQLVRMGGGVAAGLFGAGKFKKPVQKGVEKLFGKVPQATTKLGAAAAYTGKQASAGAVGSQLGFNPYDDQLGEWIAEFMPEEAGWRGDLKEYLTADRQTKTQLENRIDLLGEGVFLGLGMASVGGLWKGGKHLSESELKEKFVTAFKNNLNRIKNAGSEQVNNFLNKLEYKKSDASQMRETLRQRQDDIIDGKVQDIGDFEALKPSKYTRFLSDINLQFSSSPFLRKLDNFRTKLFSTRAGRTAELNEKFLRTENVKEKWLDNINNIATNLETSLDNLVRTVSDGNFFSNNKKENKEKFLEKLKKLLYSDFRSQTLVTSKGISRGTSQKEEFERLLKKDFPEEMWDDIRNARKLQDDLSLKMLETNSLTKTQKEIIIDNLGSYVRRSYKLYEDANYVPTQDSIREARQYLSKEILKKNPNISDDALRLEVDSQIDIILDRQIGADSFTSNLNKFDKIRKEILFGRKEIPVAIKNLLGEVSDPIQKIVLSTSKLSKFIEDTKFYNEAFESGRNIYFKTERSGVFTSEIPQGYGNLSGKYTTPEMLEYFSNYKKTGQEILERNEFSIKGGISWGYRSSLLLKGLSQAAKTVWSHTTHFKNIIGGNHMSLANGVNTLNPTKGWNIIKTLNARTRGDRAAQAYHEELSGRGLLNKGIVARDLQGLAKDTENIKQGFIIGKLDWAFDKLGLKWTARKAQNAYIKEDDFFKINMYESEQVWLNKFNNALPDDVNFNRYRFTEETLKDEAAFITRDTLPNYDLVPEMLKDLRRNPFVGKFFSFMSESVRISQGSLRRAWKEITTGKALKAQGATEAGNIILKRGANRLASFTVMAGVGAKGLELGGRAAYGITSDIVDASRDMLADYMQNANIFVTVKEDGTPAVGNLSSWDAYDFPKIPIQVLSRRILNSNNINDETLSKDIFTTLVSEMVSPFLGESLIQENMIDYVFGNGRTNTGSLMRNPFNRAEQFDDSGTFVENTINPDNLNILMANLFKDIIPGSVDRARDWAKTLDKEQTDFDQDIYPVDSAIKFLTGWGVQPLNKEYVENVFTFKARNANTEKSERLGRLYNGISKNLDRKVFLNNYLKENEYYAKTYAKTHKLIKSGNTFNVDTNKLLQDAGFSQIDRIYLRLASTYKPLGLTDGMKTRLRENATSIEQYLQILQDVNKIDSSLSNISILHDPENYKLTGPEVFEDLREDYAEGGVVSEDYPVPFVKLDPKERESDDLGGMSYAEQMNRLGFNQGGSPLIHPENKEYFTKFHNDVISQGKELQSDKGTVTMRIIGVQHKGKEYLIPSYDPETKTILSDIDAKQKYLKDIESGKLKGYDSDKSAEKDREIFYKPIVEK